MKKLITIAIVLFVSVVCRAAAPNLATEKIFDRKELRSEGHQLTIVNGAGNYFRSVSFSNDPKLEKDIEKAIEADRKKSYNQVDRWDDNRQYTILNIENNGHTINIGYYHEPDGSVRLFIQANPDAFK